MNDIELRKLATYLQYRLDQKTEGGDAKINRKILADLHAALEELLLWRSGELAVFPSGAARKRRG